MRRRDFVKGVLAAAGVAKAMPAQQTAGQAVAPAAPQTLPGHVPSAPGPVPWMSGLMEVKPLDLATLVPDAVAQTQAHFFSVAQTATLHRLCAVLLPSHKSYPGALEAGTAEFLDFLIGVSPARERQMYATGLDWLDAEARERFAVSFSQATDAQADALIRPWLRPWMGDHPPTEARARFINLAHRDIRTATVNSQAWNDAKLAEGAENPDVDIYWYPIEPDVHGETPRPQRMARPREGHGAE